MTTEELERDIKGLAEPHADDERVRLAIRATLGEQAHDRPRILGRRRLVIGSIALAATVAGTAVLLIGTSGAGPSSANAAILAHAAKAISPPANIIVHVKETGLQPNGTQATAEWWQETNAPYAIRLIKGTANPQGGSRGTTDQQVETAANGTTFSEYDAGTNTIYQRPDSTSPTLIDPLETVRAELAAGTAQVAGTVTIGGQSLYKIKLPNGVVGYFDPTSYLPVYLDNQQRDGSVVRTKVITYEELPITSQNQSLLSITAQHPRASLSTSPLPGSSGAR